MKQRPAKKKATFNLDAGLHRRLKVAAAMRGVEMVTLLTDAITLYLEAGENAHQINWSEALKDYLEKKRT